MGNLWRLSSDLYGAITVFIVGVKNSEITEKLLMWVMSKGFRRNVNGIITYVQLDFVVFNILWKDFIIWNYSSITVWLLWHFVYKLIVIKIIKYDATHPRPQAQARATLTVAQAVEQLIVIGSFALKECCGWEGNAG
jgi:hypothetical protein